MNRNECYEYIKTHNLKDEATKEARRIIGNAGANYTNMPTEKLEDFVVRHQNTCLKKNESKPAPVSTVKNVLTREECFNIIKQQNLQATVKNTFGKPFNSVSTEKLQEFIKKLDSCDKQQCETQSEPKSEQKQEFNTSNACMDVACRKAVTALCILLNRKDIAKNL